MEDRLLKESPWELGREGRPTRPDVIGTGYVSKQEGFGLKKDLEPRWVWREGKETG